MQNFKNLIVWQKAHEATLLIYTMTKTFPSEERYGLTNQIRRSASAVAANIAEGCGRRSQADFAHFLNIALASANETEYFLILGKDLRLLNIDDFNMLEVKTNEVKAMLISLIQKVRSPATTYNL